MGAEPVASRAASALAGAGRHARARQALIGASYRQVRIEGADHAWLKEQEVRR